MTKPMRIATTKASKPVSTASLFSGPRRTAWKLERGFRSIQKKRYRAPTCTLKRKESDQAMTTVTQAELARNLGVSRSYVTALKAADRLVISDDGSGIELEASLARIDATRDPQRVDVSERHASARACTLLKASQANPEENKPPPVPPAGGDPNSYQAARAIKEIYAAKLRAWNTSALLASCLIVSLLKTPSRTP